MRIAAAAASDTGRVRKLNEDSFACLPDAALFVVCDGMGGAAAGEVASQLAVQAVVDAYSQNNSNAADDGFRPATQRLRRAIEHANRLVYERAREDDQHAGMGTTVVAAAI